ncbi:MAG: aminodeoxychorismate/anthranilate synthase component II [Rhodospirillaceae bacterium]|nr:aminodeoxychorismate/anthranilate synthase component II [Rhodospirillaceae bacterium]
MFILIDNYDSFTYNLYHYLGELGATMRVHRNDQITVDEVMAAAPQGIILSPGPATPNQAGICLDLVKTAAGKIPLFGVCLGHQAIGQVFGGDVVRAPTPMHGKLSRIRHSGNELFDGIDGPFVATRYHSLIVDRETFPDALEVTAETDDGIVMALRHRKLPLWGVQFHPESIESQHGHRILANFLRLAGHNADAPMLRKSA